MHATKGGGEGAPLRDVCSTQRTSTNSNTRAAARIVTVEERPIASSVESTTTTPPPGYKAPRFPKELLRRHRNGERHLVATQLDGADLEDADLREIDLSDSSLREANLLSAVLSDSKLCRTNLAHANLAESDLRRADLSGAELMEADLFFAALAGADLSNTNFGYTALCAVNLGQVLGLETARHSFPSFLSHDTLAASAGRLPDTFLRGCGLSDWEIEAARLHDTTLGRNELKRIHKRMLRLRESVPRQSNPVFICYASQDETLGHRIHDGLQAKGVRCWHHLRGADPSAIDHDERIRTRRNPTVILLLSTHSVNEPWVQTELELGKALSKLTKRRVVHTLHCDNAWQEHSWPESIRDQIQRKSMIDFSHSDDDPLLARQLDNLIQKHNLLARPTGTTHRSID
ncbi:MAG: toll/interleukin-1 receptor domain-containing protein [Nannocystaceae bacterium]